MSAFPHGSNEALPTDAITALRISLRDAELAVIDLNRELMQRRLTGRQTSDVTLQLSEMIEARDSLRARLLLLQQGGTHG